MPPLPASSTLLGRSRRGWVHALLSRVYDLGIALPDDPLHRFETEVRHLPRGTEAEGLVIQRRGQSIFRDSLMKFWQGRCPVTGISDPELLRASHMKPWAKCATDAERLNVYNGLLLSALWDAAFDKGLVTFNDDGCVVFSPHLSGAAPERLTAEQPARLPLRSEHATWLAYHRANEFRV